MHEWVILTTRLGVTVNSPKEIDLERALLELFASPEDKEHPDCWIECGSTGGSLYTLNVYQSGYAVFTEFSDVDMSEELQSKRFPALSVYTALDLWNSLIQKRLCFDSVNIGM